MGNPSYPLSIGASYLIAYGLPVFCAFLGWMAVSLQGKRVQFKLAQLVSYVVTIGLSSALQLAVEVEIGMMVSGEDPEVSGYLPIVPWMAICLASLWMLAGHLTCSALFLPKNNATEKEMTHRADLRVSVYAILICFFGSAFSHFCLLLRVLFMTM